MSEFKFACPVCGQHITADSNATGSQLECPTCFRKIVVPQAPTSADPKFVLSAAQADKPRPPQTTATSQLGPIRTVPEPTPIPIVLVVLILVGVAGGLVFAFRGKIFHSEPPPVTETVADTTAEQSNATHTAQAENSYWTLNLTNVTYPETTASGKIHQRDFVCDLAVAQAGIFTLRTGNSGLIDLGLTIVLYARRAEDLGGKTINVTTNAPIAPRVVLRWMDGEQPVVERFTGGYALRMEFGTASGGLLPGKIYLCLPDEAKSYVVGTFNAQIQNPPVPVQRPPRRRR